MKTTMKLLAAVLALLALAGCNLSTKTIDAAKASGKMTAYTMFEPADEDDLRAAALNGEANAGYVIAKVKSGFDASKFARLGAAVVGYFDMGGNSYYRLFKEGGAVKLVASLFRTDGIVYAQHELLSSIPDNELSSSSDDDMMAQSRDAGAIAAVFNDPETWGRFGHFEITKALDAYKAYDVGTNTVYIADIDTGINRTHEDFALSGGGQIIEYAKSAFNSTNGGASFSFVGDGNAFVEVPTNENWDDIGHGTHTAGTIAALGNNGKGVAGVAWKNVRLISYKCFSDYAPSGSGSDWAVYGGLADLITWKTTHSVTQTIPVNMSLGSSYAGYFELDMINQALANDIMVVASMGNSGYNAPQYPAAYTGVLAVGATRADGSKVHFSTSGNFISVSAPGYNIYSTYMLDDSSYIDMSGTSMSAPFVTGTIAYLLTFNPTLKPDQLKTMLESTAIDLGDPGWDEDTGYGLVNVKAAVDLVKNNSVPASGSVYSTKTVKISVINTNTHYNSEIIGHEDAVVGQTVYIYDSDGDYVCMGITNAIDGSAEFKMLKPGTYTARTNYLGTMQQAGFTVNSISDTPPFALSFDIAVLLIQTVPNLAKDPSATSAADTIITVYDSAGNTIAGPFDSGLLDTFSVAGLATGSTYAIGITQYNATTGEYGLNVGFTGVDSVNTTNGRGVGADDGYEENDSFATAHSITVGTDYGMYLGDADYYSFVMP